MIFDIDKIMKTILNDAGDVADFDSDAALDFWNKFFSSNFFKWQSGKVILKDCIQCMIDALDLLKKHIYETISIN